MEIIIRPIEEEDLPILWELIYKEEAPEWKKWDAPYFEHKRISLEEYLSKKEAMLTQDTPWVIEVAGEVMGLLVLLGTQAILLA